MEVNVPGKWNLVIILSMINVSIEILFGDLINKYILL